jgi:hypothetical protein
MESNAEAAMTGVLAGLVELHNHEPQVNASAAITAVAGVVALIVFLALRRIHTSHRHSQRP